MLAVLIVLFAAATPAEGRWTFCVAEAGADIWITDVFQAARKREKLEASFAALLRARGVVDPATQCPAPIANKTDAFNAQFTAAEFHRKLGQTLHAVELPVSAR